MLKFLTHKLRTHSINEDNYIEKVDEDHDSGTESDDEIEHPEIPAIAMSERVSSVSPADTGCSVESPIPDQQDPHSSEEELEVINSPRETRHSRSSSACMPEKRKWSQIRYSPENEENMSHYGNITPATSSPCSPCSKLYSEDAVHIEHSGSSDDEMHNLLESMATPVQFRTSPPLEAVKPGGRVPNKLRAHSPPPKLLHYEVSPRKRSRHMSHANVQRPCLDFEKMQQMSMVKFKVQGLVADLLPNIRLMQASGYFMFNYHAENGGAMHSLRIGYSVVVLALVLLQYGFLFGNLAQEAGDVNNLAANTITVLFFTHCVTKFIYFAVRSKLFYRTLGIWNQANTHPLFVESNNRYHGLALMKIRRVLMIVVTGTVLSAVSWTGLTFVGDSVHTIKDPQNENDTITEEIPRLLVRSWYPFDAMSGMMYYVALLYQVYWVFITMFHSNLLDVMFCSWLIFACEQLQHLKEIMKPLMELSATLDTYVPKTAELFRAPSMTSQDNLIENDYNEKNEQDLDLRGVYSTRQELGGHFRSSALQAFGPGGGGGVGPNGLTKKQELMVRSAIKYWVERHKHVVRLVTAIGDCYGIALLLHMLTSTITLTILAYQATKIDGVTKYAASVLGYLFYTLSQVFLFCIFGNRLIEESSSVMEAAYSCHWYDGSEEAKTFVQIVCQQCQKAMSISGAKFFTISLDLFASVLGAVVTYFMVLVQLN